MKVVKRYIDCPYIAEEVLNNGWLRIFQKISTYNHTGSFAGWARKLVYHTVSDCVKTDKRIITAKKYEKGMRPTQSIDKINSNGDYYSIEIPVIDNDNSSEKEYWQLIEGLAKTTSIVFKLFIEGFSHRKIGDIMNITDGTSKWHVSEARRILREKISNQ